MKLKIGFNSVWNNAPEAEPAQPEYQPTVAPRRSVVQVRFPGWNRDLAYYNDRFDLKKGDLVFVDGKLAGKQGRVTQVSYNFKIRLSDYQQVIAVADTRVAGRFFYADSHLVSFDPEVLSVPQVRAWFLPPVSTEDETVSGSDGSDFPLSDLRQMNIPTAVAQRGHEYYLDNRVRCLSLRGDRGYAIVEGTQFYEVEFEYRDGRVSRLTCPCYCSGGCKHEFAALLQLQETLELIETRYADEYARTGCFTAIFKPTLFQYAVDTQTTGSLTLS